MVDPTPGVVLRPHSFECTKECGVPEGARGRGRGTEGDG